MLILLYTHVVYIIKAEIKEKKKKKFDKMNRFAMIYAEDNETEDLDVRTSPPYSTR
jgi:hypothetical protein